jgi:hypothetical protein
MAKKIRLPHKVCLETLYEILTEVVSGRLVHSKDNPRTIGYLELSKIYYQRTRQPVAPFSGWGEPLYKLNERLHKKGYPLLSTVVVNRTTKLPGPGYWVCDGLPAQPKTIEGERKVWEKVHREVCSQSWQSSFPVRKAA